MRAVRNFLLIALTVALMAAGALLPYGTAAMQDRRLENSGDARELSGVQLLIQQDMSAAQVLNLLGGEYTTVAWDSGTNLTASEAMDHAFDQADLMILESLIPESALDSSYSSGDWLFGEWDATANAFLVISNGENREALLLWECTWESPGDAVYTVWIDDATGMMYGFNRTEAGGFISDAAKNPKVLYERADRWSFFLSCYYDFIELDSEIRTKEVSGDEIWDTFILTLKFKNTEDALDICTVQLKFQGENISFLC